MRHRPATSLGRALIAGSGAGAILVAATVPFLGRYGWDRDELYFMSASHHLALGYVDFPPVTAWVAWLVCAIAGDSLEALRAVSLACGVATVILVALMARELGGGFAAQFGGAALWALTPLILGSASIYHPTWFDQLAWVAFLYVATRILVRPEPRLWPLLGVVAGFGSRPSTRSCSCSPPSRFACWYLPARLCGRAVLGSPRESPSSCSCRTSSGRLSTAGRAPTSRRARTRRRPRTPPGPHSSSNRSFSSAPPSSLR